MGSYREDMETDLLTLMLANEYSIDWEAQKQVIML